MAGIFPKKVKTEVGATGSRSSFMGVCQENSFLAQSSTTTTHGTSVSTFGNGTATGTVAKSASPSASAVPRFLCIEGYGGENGLLPVTNQIIQLLASPESRFSPRFLLEMIEDLIPFLILEHREEETAMLLEHGARLWDQLGDRDGAKFALARADFFRGRFAEAEATLASLSPESVWNDEAVKLALQISRLQHEEARFEEVQPHIAALELLRRIATERLLLEKESLHDNALTIASQVEQARADIDRAIANTNRALDEMSRALMTRRVHTLDEAFARFGEYTTLTAWTFRGDVKFTGKSLREQLWRTFRKDVDEAIAFSKLENTSEREAKLLSFTERLRGERHQGSMNGFPAQTIFANILALLKSENATTRNQAQFLYREYFGHGTFFEWDDTSYAATLREGGQAATTMAMAGMVSGPAGAYVEGLAALRLANGASITLRAAMAAKAAGFATNATLFWAAGDFFHALLIGGGEYLTAKGLLRSYLMLGGLGLLMKGWGGTAGKALEKLAKHSPALKIPAAMTNKIGGLGVEWAGFGVIQMFEGLVGLTPHVSGFGRALGEAGVALTQLKLAIGTGNMVTRDAALIKVAEIKLDVVKQLTEQAYKAYRLGEIPKTAYKKAIGELASIQHALATLKGEDPIYDIPGIGIICADGVPHMSLPRGTMMSEGEKGGGEGNGGKVRPEDLRPPQGTFIIGNQANQHPLETLQRMLETMAINYPGRERADPQDRPTEEVRQAIGEHLLAEAKAQQFEVTTAQEAYALWNAIAQRAYDGRTLEVYLMFRLGYHAASYLPDTLRTHRVVEASTWDGSHSHGMYDVDSMRVRELTETWARNGEYVENAEAIATAMALVEQQYPALSGELRTDDFRSHDDGYDFSPRDVVRRQELLERVLRSGTDHFPELNLTGLSEADAVAALRAFLEAYRRAERHVYNGDENNAHCGLASRGLVALFQRKGMKAFVLGVDRLHEGGSFPHAVTAVRLGNRFYLVDINGQQFGESYDRLVLIPIEEAATHGFILDRPFEEQLCDFRADPFRKLFDDPGSLTSDKDAYNALVRKYIEVLGIEIPRAAPRPVHADPVKVERGRENIRTAFGNELASQAAIIASWPEDVQQRFLADMETFDPQPKQKPKIRIVHAGEPKSPQKYEQTNPAEELKQKISQVDEFYHSLSESMDPAKLWNRIAATPAEAQAFHQTFKSTVGGEVAIPFEGKEYIVDRGTLQKMETWAREQSKDLSIETSGYFEYEQQGDRIILKDFIPAASISGSIAYMRMGRGVAYGGEGQMSTHVLRQSGAEKYFSRFEGVDPLFYTDQKYGDGPERYLNFHSHFTTSRYQNGPSPGDYEGLKPEVRILWTPGVGAPQEGGNLIFYKAENRTKGDATSLSFAAFRLPRDSFIPVIP